jgi:hypothetical protein
MWIAQWLIPSWRGADFAALLPGRLRTSNAFSSTALSSVADAGRDRKELLGRNQP